MSRNVHDLIGDISEMLDEVECEYINVSEDIQRKLKDFKEQEKEFLKTYEEGIAKGEQLMQEKVNKMLEFREHTKWEIIEDIFGTKTALVDFIININESYDKIMEYENEKKQEEFHVGDEVVDVNGDKYIVRKIDDGQLYLLEESGDAVTWGYSNVSKTGKHYPLEEMLKELE